MLSIREEVTVKLTGVFQNSKQEKGFLLGCSSRLDCVDHCEQIPAIRAGLHFYEPDSAYADGVIQKWAADNICFCGFLHSHLVDKTDLSIPDIQFARKLFQAYSLPVLWFGLALVEGKSVTYRFYIVTEQGIDDLHTNVCIDYPS